MLSLHIWLIYWGHFLQPRVKIIFQTFLIIMTFKLSVGRETQREKEAIIGEQLSSLPSGVYYTTYFCLFQGRKLCCKWTSSERYWFTGTNKGNSVINTIWSSLWRTSSVPNSFTQIMEPWCICSYPYTLPHIHLAKVECCVPTWWVTN